VRRRAAGSLAALVALWIAAACLDITSNVPSIASITPVILPSPSVVVGDSSRDTAGGVAPLRLLAFGPNGQPLSASDVIVKFFAADSTTVGLFVDSLTGMAFGKALSGSAGVVAQVRQANGVGGFIQTNVVAFPVVPIPDSGTRSADTTFTFSGTVSATDTLNSGLLSPPLTVTVHGGLDTLVQKYVVEFHIDSAPSPRAGASGPTVVLRGNGADSNVAVTNAAGQASLQLRVRPSAIPQDVQAGQKTDTVFVSVRVLYKGAPIVIKPSPVFTIPITGTITP
jgi:hypothetical protein